MSTIRSQTAEAEKKKAAERRKIFFPRLILLIVLAFATSGVFGQKNIRIGFDLGHGTQRAFPFHDPVYYRKTTGYKVEIYYPLKEARWSWEVLVEPSYYYARQRLRIPEYVTEAEYGPDYLELRAVYSQMRTINEFALNAGIVSRYNFSSAFSAFFLISSGPFYGDKKTERLAKGFAFSDVTALGTTYANGRLRFEFRAGLRHVSNLNTQHPNKGHNTSTLDFGITWLFKKNGTKFENKKN
jgi:hypothetical protein